MHGQKNIKLYATRPTNSRLYRHSNFETRHSLLVLNGYEAWSLTLREEQML